jgi:uncharacterized protein YyaL (SSP411 family)
MLCAVDFAIEASREIAIAGKPESAEVQALLAALHSRFLPNTIVALVDPDSAGAHEARERIPLLRDRGVVAGKAAAYVCRNRTCSLPVTTPEDLRKTLDAS